MLNDISSNQQVCLVTGYTDLRRSIDGLAMIIQGQLRLDPFSSALFLFCGRCRDHFLAVVVVVVVVGTVEVVCDDMYSSKDTE